MILFDHNFIVILSLLDKAFIFQLHHKHCLEYLLEIFQADIVIKVGFGLKSDKSHIYNKFGVKLNAVLDLNTKLIINMRLQSKEVNNCKQ